MLLARQISGRGRAGLGDGFLVDADEIAAAVLAALGTDGKGATKKAGARSLGQVLDAPDAAERRTDGKRIGALVLDGLRQILLRVVAKIPALATERGRLQTDRCQTTNR
ncbi:hypothetical protein ACLOJK_012483 [Asimina triloba]